VAVATLPRLPAPFRTHGAHIRIDLPGGSALFSTRRDGVSKPPFDTLNLAGHVGDDPAAVEANHARLAALGGLPRSGLAEGHLVHVARVCRLRRVPDPGAPVQDADGQATALAGVGVMVLAADCLPVALIADGAVATVHAGWRGLAAGVIEEGARALRELGARGPLHAAIGPGAGPCCYEVGDDVRAAFAEHGDAVLHGRRIDLKAIGALKLRAAGVGAVHDVGLCTICSDPALLFSHRRAGGGPTGRQAALAWRS
jgi:YfiH family protein